MNKKKYRNTSQNKKLPSLKVAIFAISLIITNSAAQAYDVFEYSGAIPTEIHNLQALIPALGDPDCVGLCSLLGERGEYNTALRIQNLTTGFTAGVPNAAVDTYAGNVEMASAGALPIFLQYSEYIPGSIDTEYLSTYNPTVPDESQSHVPYQWEFTTSAEGKIIDGHIAVYNGFAGVVHFTVYDFSSRSFFILDGCSRDQNFLPIAPSITGLRNLDISDLPGTLPATGCTSLELKAPLAYLTCDTHSECGQFDKAVPVPAFAAAVLGLGILGITRMRRNHPNCDV